MIKGSNMFSKNTIKNFKLSGFTLAEVLITLGIIGVVAAITIPNLMTSYKRIVLDSKFRKTYANLHQVVKQWQDYEEDDVYALYYDATDKKGDALRTSFYSFLKGSYNANVGPESGLKTYYTSAKGSTTKVHYCPPSSCAHPYVKSFSGYDGVTYKISARDGFINIAVDINGYDSPPNKWGIDLFDFDYTSDNVLKTPIYGCTKGNCSTYFQSSSTHVNDGIGCTTCAVVDRDYFKRIQL